MDGILLVDKPCGMTSHDVVFKVRKSLSEPRIGHTGTLDPMASGLLVLCLGRATKLVRYLSEHDKVYEATFLVGIAIVAFRLLRRRRPPRPPSRPPPPRPMPPRR